MHTRQIRSVALPQRTSGKQRLGGYEALTLVARRDRSPNLLLPSNVDQCSNNRRENT